MRRVSPATVMSALALFFSLGGVGLAASGYRITSIWQIKPSVRHALRGERGPRGFTGPQGVRGTTGPAGPTGTFSTAKIAQIAGPATDCAAGESSCIATVYCPDHSIAVGGGMQQISKPPQDDQLQSDEPFDADLGWNVVLSNSNSETPVSFRAVVLCAS